MMCCRSLPCTCMFGNLFHHNFLVCIMDLCPSLVLKFHCRSFHILHRRGKIVVSTSNLFISCHMVHYWPYFDTKYIGDNIVGAHQFTNSQYITSEVHVVGCKICIWIESSVHLNLQPGEGIRMWIYHGGLISVTRAAHHFYIIWGTLYIWPHYILHTINTLRTKLLGTLYTLLGILCSLAKFWYLKAPSWMIYHYTGTMVIYGITIWLTTVEIHYWLVNTRFEWVLCNVVNSFLWTLNACNFTSKLDVLLV